MARCFAVIGAPQTGKSALVDHLVGLEGGPAAQPPDDPAHTRVARFDYLGESWSALDCPGSPEFRQEMLDALMVADAAVIVVSPDPDHAALAAPALRAAEAAGTPAFLFINRMDEATAPARDVVSGLQSFANHPIVLRQIPIRRDDDVIGAIDLISERAWRYREEAPSSLIEIPAGVLEREQEARETLLESLSEHDDWLLEEIIEARTPAEGPLYAICARALQEGRVIEAFLGSARHGNGVRRLMKALRHEAPTPAATRIRLAETLDAAPDAIAAVSFGARHRRHVGKATLLRVFHDGLKAGGMLGDATLGVLADAASDKPNAIGPIEAGGVAAALKSDHLERGRVYSTTESRPGPAWRAPIPPQTSCLIRPRSEREDVKLSEALAKIVADDPALRISQAPGSGALVVEAQGDQHLRATQIALAEIFGVETTLEPAPTQYRETITRTADMQYRHKKQSGGSGQFADVTLTVAPGARGSGFRFEERVKGGAVPRNHIPAVESGARDALTEGPLGFPVVDVVVTLTDGRHHSVDSSDLAFRIAGRQATAQALSQAAPVLLEPYCSVQFFAPSDNAGALSQIVGAHRGQVLGFDRDPDQRGWDVFRALIPAAALQDLGRELSAATQGVGRFEASFDHYQELYGKEADQIAAGRRDNLSMARRSA